MSNRAAIERSDLGGDRGPPRDPSLIDKRTTTECDERSSTREEIQDGEIS